MLYVIRDILKWLLLSAVVLGGSNLLLSDVVRADDKIEGPCVRISAPKKVATYYPKCELIGVSGATTNAVLLNYDGSKYTGKLFGGTDEYSFTEGTTTVIKKDRSGKAESISVTVAGGTGKYHLGILILLLYHHRRRSYLEGVGACLSAANDCGRGAGLPG